MMILVWLKRLILGLHLGPLMEFCKRCGHRQPFVWTAKNKDWAAITGRNDGSGIYCPKCFDRMAQKKGIVLRWLPTREDIILSVKPNEWHK